MDNLVGFVIKNYDNSLSLIFSKNIGINVVNLLLYSFAVFAYVVIIWHLYQNLARKNLFDKEMSHSKTLNKGFWHGVWHLMVYLFRYGVIFPVISFIWFLILSGFLLFLSKSHDVEHILMMSATVIATSRVTAYYRENLAQDVAKLVPLTLLGIFIVDQTYFSIDDTLAKFYAVPQFIHVILQSLIFLMILEFSLQIFDKVKSKLSKQKN